MSTGSVDVDGIRRCRLVAALALWHSVLMRPDRTSTSDPDLPLGHEDGRVPVRVRIGVVGHRWIPEDDPAARDAVDEALTTLWNLRSVTATRHTAVDLTIVSSLAEGADRIAADVGVDRGARLEVVLPMEPGDFEEDFSGASSIERFRDLMCLAGQVTVIDEGSDRDAGYLHAGLRLVDTCDALLALWDGKPARGIGGTASIVDYADVSGVPVLWVEAARGSGSFTARPRPDHPLPGRLPSPDPRSFAALDVFNSAHLMSAKARAVARIDPSHPLQPYFARADLLAIRYQRLLLRSSQVIYALAVVAVAAAAGGLAFWDEARWVTWIEVVALGVITAVLLTGRRMQLLRRWLSARQFAERLRIAVVLRSVGSASPPQWGQAQQTGSWVESAIEELWLSTPSRGPRPSLSELKRQVTDEWLLPQISYHRTAQHRAEHRHRISAPLTVGLFALSLLAALLHALGIFPQDSVPWAFISIVTPAAAAALSGYVGQREYLRRAIRSRQTAEALTRAHSEVDHAEDEDDLQRIVGALEPELVAEAQDWSTTTTIHDLDVP